MPNETTTQKRPARGQVGTTSTFEKPTVQNKALTKYNCLKTAIFGLESAK
jgi:hypothetical protein